MFALIVEKNSKGSFCLTVKLPSLLPTLFRFLEIQLTMIDKLGDLSIDILVSSLDQKCD